MTGFIHAGETDDKTAAPDFISAVKLMVRENKKITEREKHSRSDADVSTERNVKRKKKSLRGQRGWLEAPSWCSLQGAAESCKESSRGLP